MTGRGFVSVWSLGWIFGGVVVVVVVIVNPVVVHGVT